MSDHLLSLVVIHNQSTDKTEHWEFNCRSLNEVKMKEINKLLLQTDWSTLSTQDVNKSFSELQDRIEECMNAIAPLKTIKIPMHKAWHEPWITKGISNSMKHCTRLYKNSLKKDAIYENVSQYKNYRNCLTKIKRKAQTNYYINRCYALKSNMKKLWQLINNIIRQSNDKTSIIEYITVDNINYHDAKEISNQFGKYYSKLGEKLSQKLQTKNISITNYLEKIKTNPKTLFMCAISTKEVQKQ